MRNWGGKISGTPFSPDGRSVVRPGPDNTAVVFDTDRQAERITLRGHTAPVSVAVFSPDGARILTASEDGTARLWNAATGATVGVMRSSRAPIQSVAFASDGAEALVLSDDGALRQYQLFADLPALAAHAEATLPRKLTPAQRAEFWLPVIEPEPQ